MIDHQAPAPEQQASPHPGGLPSYGISPAEAAREVRRAQVGVAATYVFWGIMPIYWSFLPAMPAYEIVLQRLIWTTICSFFVVLYRKQLKATLALAFDKQNMPVVLGCAVLTLSSNLVFIWAVTNNQVVEASLGYFLTPIFQMAFGIMFFKDRTSFLQKSAIALACLGVGIQIYMLGKLPLVALGIAVTFAGYTALKKVANYGTGPGLFWETAVATPLAIIAILWLELNGQGNFTASTRGMIMLILTGPITTFPLLWFSFGAKKLSLITVGLLQYITPSMTLMLGIFWFKEAVEARQLISFAFIVASLCIYTYEMVRHMHMAERWAHRHRRHKLEKMHRQGLHYHHPRPHKQGRKD